MLAARRCEGGEKETSQSGAMPGTWNSIGEDAIRSIGQTFTTISDSHPVSPSAFTALPGTRMQSPSVRPPLLRCSVWSRVLRSLRVLQPGRFWTDLTYATAPRPILPAGTGD